MPLTVWFFMIWGLNKHQLSNFNNLSCQVLELLARSQENGMKKIYYMGSLHIPTQWVYWKLILTLMKPNLSKKRRSVISILKILLLIKFGSHLKTVLKFQHLWWERRRFCLISIKNQKSLFWQCYMLMEVMVCLKLLNSIQPIWSFSMISRESLLS